MRFLRKQCNGFDLMQIDSWESGSYSGTFGAENSQYSFQLARDAEAKPWLIQELKRKSGPEPVHHSALMGLSLDRPQREVPTLVRSPFFKLTDLASNRENGEDLVRMTFSYSPQDKDKDWLRGGWVLLDPKHNWIVKKSQLGLEYEGQQIDYRVQYDYKEGSNHRPIITRSLIKSTTKEKDPPLYAYEIATDFDLHEQEVVPEKEFMLSAFGLPEPPGEGRTTQWYLWLGGLGLGCLVLGAIVAHLRRRASAG